MKKIGILGGTFDPPHSGHLIIANEVRHALQLDEIWFMPNKNPPHKQKSEKVPNEDRISMLKLAIGDNNNFRVETIEMQRNGPSYTFETMTILTKRHAEHEFYFIIGADMVEYLPKWHKIDELIQLVRFVGVKRPGYQLETVYPIMSVDVPLIGISSSDIRLRIKENRPIDYLLPSPVISYIKERQIYES